jgi:hypothetical protein
LPDDNCWLVLTVQQGDAFWWFADTDKPPAPVKTALYQLASGGWLACPEKLWLQTRIRLVDQNSKKLKQVVLGCGGYKNTLPVEQGVPVIKATSDDIIKIKEERDAKLTIEITAEAAGMVTLSKLRMVYL